MKKAATPLGRCRFESRIAMASCAIADQLGHSSSPVLTHFIIFLMHLQERKDIWLRINKFSSTCKKYCGRESNLQ